MAGKSRLKSTLLCIALMMICMAGCDTAEGNSGIGETIRENETPTADEDAGMADGIAAGQEETSYIPAVGEENAAEDTEAEITFEGLGLSILGDSISTYEGYIPEGFVVFYPMDGEVKDVSQTWWMKLLDDTGMELCRNDSSSGSTCVGDSLSIDNPKYGCSGLRTSLLTGEQGRMPDIIIIYMGTNDLLIGVPLGDNDGTQLVEEGIVDNFSDAYSLILDKVVSNYPVSEVYCCTLPTIGKFGEGSQCEILMNRIGLTSDDYSRQIQIIAKSKGISVIDLSDCGIDLDNLREMTTDGVHMTPAGMECVERAMLRSMGLTPDE